MGQKLYYFNANGSIEFQSERKAWGVDIPAYVYDLWMPLIGSDTIGVYGVYCRLERDHKVFGLTMEKLARKCRIGKDKLAKINTKLTECGFIRIEKPQGWQRLAHFTTTIITLDPPQQVSVELIEKYSKGHYEPLSPWLVAEEDRTNHLDDLNGSSGQPNQVVVDDPNGSSNIEPSYVAPSHIDPLNTIRPADENQSPAAGERARDQTPRGVDNRVGLDGVVPYSPRRKKDISGRALTLKLIEWNGNQYLPKGVLIDINSEIPCWRGGLPSIYPPLVDCYDEFVGFRDFVQNRYDQFQAMNAPFEIRNFVRNLRNFKKEDGLYGWLKWKEQNPSVVNQKLAKKKPPQPQYYIEHEPRQDWWD